MEEKSCLNSQWIEGFATTHQQSKWDLLFCILNFLSAQKESVAARFTQLFWSSKQQKVMKAPGWGHLPLKQSLEKGEKGTVNTRWSWRSLILNSRCQRVLNSTYLCAQQTLSTSRDRKAGLPGSGAGSPRCSDISSGHFYRTWPASNWLCSLGQWASGGSSEHLDTAGDTLGGWNELPCAGGTELHLLLPSFQVASQKTTDAFKFMPLSRTAAKFHLSHRNHTVNNARWGQQIRGFKGSSSLQSSSQNCTFIQLFVKSWECDSFVVTRSTCWHLSQLW